MKTILALIGVVTLCLGIALWAPTTHSQVLPILNQATIAWDAVNTDVLGNPEIIRDAELGLWPVGIVHQTTAPIAVLSGLPGTPPVGGIALGNLFAGRAAGDYQLAVRVYDLAGNFSAWSSAVAGRYDPIAPSPPGNIRIVVEVRVSVTQ